MEQHKMCLENQIDLMNQLGDDAKLLQKDLIYYKELKEGFHCRTPQVCADIAEKMGSEMMQRCRSMAAFTGTCETDGNCILNPAGFPGISVSEIEGSRTYPKKRMDCREFCTSGERMAREFLVLFGKFDMLTAAPMPHAYWSNILRKEIAIRFPVIGDFISIPASRIKYDWIVGDEWVENVHSVEYSDDLTRPVVLWTFVDFNNPKNDGSGEEIFQVKDHTWSTLSNIVDTVLGYQGDNQVSMRQKYPNRRIECFLSFSTHFPIIIKAELESFHKVEEHLDELRRIDGIRSTASIIGIKNDFLKQHNDVELNIFPEVKENVNQGLRVGILLKVTPGYETAVRYALYHDLCKVLGEEEFEFFISDRAYYYDLFAVLKTKQLGKVMKYVIEYLSEHRIGELSSFCLPQNALEKIITIPLWTTENIARMKKPELPAGDGPQRVSDLPDRIAKNTRNLNLLFTEFQQLFITGSFTEGEPPMADLMIRRFYYLKYDIEWLFSLAQQTQMAWNFYLKMGEETFYRLNKLFDEIMKKMMILHEAISQYIEKYAELKDSYEYSTSMNWSNIQEVESLLLRVRRAIYFLRSEYHTKMEGLQAMTMTEPHMLFGERSGVTDIYMEATSYLMDEYCGNWCIGDPRSKKSEYLRIWNGIVLISTDNYADYHILPELQLLARPLDYKSHIHRKLLPLAHESCHQVIFDIMVNKFSKSPVRDKMLLWYNDLMDRCRIKAEQILEWFAIDHIRDKEPFYEVQSLYIDMVGCKKKFEPPERSMKRSMNFPMHGNELIIDMLSILSAGPAVVSNIAELNFSGTEMFGNQHPPSWFRCCVLMKFMESMKLDYDPWTCDGQAGFKNRKKEHLYQTILNLEDRCNGTISDIIKILEGDQEAIRFYMRICVCAIQDDFQQKRERAQKSTPKVPSSEDTIKPDGEENLPSPEGRKESEPANQLAFIKLQDLKEMFNIFFDPYVYMAMVLLENDGEMARKLALICRDYSRDFLFYPIDDNGRIVGEEAKKVHEKCLQVAFDLMHNERVVTNAELRHIAAATMLPVMKRPLIPCGRVVHSIYYSRK